MKEHQNIIKIHSVYKFELNEDIAYFIELELADTNLEKIIKNISK